MYKRSVVTTCIKDDEPLGLALIPEKSGCNTRVCAHRLIQLTACCMGSLITESHLWKQQVWRSIIRVTRLFYRLFDSSRLDQLATQAVETEDRVPKPGNVALQTVSSLTHVNHMTRADLNSSDKDMCAHHYVLYQCMFTPSKEGLVPHSQTVGTCRTTWVNEGLKNVKSCVSRDATFVDNTELFHRFGFRKGCNLLF